MEEKIVQPRIIFTGAGSSGKTTLKEALAAQLTGLGWISRDSSASSRKTEWGIDPQNPTPEQQTLFQRKAFDCQLQSDKEERGVSSVSDRFALDYLAFTSVLTPELFEEQRNKLMQALEEGVYARDLIYYTQPLPKFHPSASRFSDQTIYETVDQQLKQLLKDLKIQYTIIESKSTVQERVTQVLNDLEKQKIILLPR